MRRSKAEVDRYISSAQCSSPSTKDRPIKGFLYAKLYFEAKEYDLAKRHVSAYLTVQERDPKAHKFLGHLYERDEDINKAVGCYKRSVDLNPAQPDVVLKIAGLLCSKDQVDSRAQFWVEKASKMMPGNPAVFNLKERLLSGQGQQGWNQLYDLLQAELALRPGDAHVNVKLVQLYSKDGRLEEAVKHCVAAEKRGLLRHSLDWHRVVVHTLEEYLEQPSVSSNEKLCRRHQRDLLLAHCSLLRITLSGKGLQPSLEALRSFDQAMQSLSKAATSVADELSEVFAEMRAHLYLQTGTLLLKMAQEREQEWRAVVDLAALCYLLAYQVPRPKARVSKGDQALPQPLELLANDRQSQAGHMLLNLSSDVHTFTKQVVEVFGNRSGQGSLFSMLYGPQVPAGASFLGSDDIRTISTQAPDISDLIKWDNGSVLLHGGDLQHLSWLGLQWILLAQRPGMRDWLQQLFPRLTLETSKLETNAPESICLLDLEVFVCGVAFCSHTQLQETANISSNCGGGGGGGQRNQLEPRCLPLPLLRLLSTERQREWWDAVYTLIHSRALPGTSGKLRMIVQHGLSTLRGGEKHGLQPALAIHWAQHLSQMGVGVNSYYEQKEYIERSVHYWRVVLPLLEKIRRRRSIPEPLDPLFMHFPSRDIQVSAVKGYEDEAKIASATLLDIEDKTEEAIAALESINNISSHWHLARIFQRLSEEAGNGVEETQDRCIMSLRKLKTYLTKIYNANADDMDRLPVSMEEVMDLLNDVNQQLGEDDEGPDEVEENGRGPGQSSPGHLTETAATISHLKYSPSPSKSSIISPSKRHLISPKTPPLWVEDQKNLIQMLCRKVEELQNEVRDLRHSTSENAASPRHRPPYAEGYGAEGLLEGYPPAQPFHGAPLTVTTTGPSVYPGPAYNTQYLLRPAANVTPTKTPMYGMTRLPPQQPHMYAYQPPTHTPPMQSTPACMYAPPQDQVFGTPMRFESPATGLLSPYSEEYYGHSVGQPTTNPPLPEPGYFTQPPLVPVQPPKSMEGKPVDFGKISFGQPAPVDKPAVPSFGAGVVAQSTPTSAFKFKSNFKSNDGDFTFPPSSVPKNSDSLLGLLTSDLPPKTDGTPEPKLPAQEPSAGQGGGNLFTFGPRGLSGFTFTDSAKPPAAGPFAGAAPKAFSFTDYAPPTFGSASGGVGAAEEEKASESNNESSHAEEDEDGPHFEPIVPLPDKVDVKTGEEEEDELFCNRAKLFRFDPETKEWKERGIGNVKFLRHSTSGKVRLLMRREQVLKICANHYITADMLLRPNAGSDKSWVWNAVDYADEMPRTEQLAIRFKTSDEASLFQTKFDEAQRTVPRSPEKGDASVKEEEPSVPPAAQTPQAFGAQFALKEGEWECDVCLVKNGASSMQCVACQSANPSGPSKPPAASITTVFGAQFALKEGEWECNVCLVKNGASSMQCVACQSANPSAPSKSADDKPVGEAKGLTGGAAKVGGFTFGFKADSSADTSSSSTSKGFGTFGSTIPSSFTFGTSSGTAAPETDTKPAATSFGAGFGAGFGAKLGSPAAAAPETKAITPVTSTAPSTASTMPFGSGFGAQFGKKPGQWDCDACAVRNEGSASSCVSCQTPIPSAKSKNMAVVAPTTKPAAAPSSTGFGALSVKKDGQWDCDACLVRNEASAAKCVACDTPCPNPSLAAMFAKKDGQWDCDACLVRNDGSAGSCVSCLAANPNAPSQGSGPPSSSAFSFSFGTKGAASSQPSGAAFTNAFNAGSGSFQFGTAKGAAKDEGKDTSSAASFKFQSGPQAEANPPSAAGFSFTMPVPAGGFTFGTQEPAKETPPPAAPSTAAGSASMFLKNIAEQHREKEKEPLTDADPDLNPLLTGKPDSFSFADLAETSHGDFLFGQSDPNFSGFSRAGEPLFRALQPGPAAQPDEEEEEGGDMYRTEEEDDIQFEPVVQMPDKVDLSTGEEDEETLYAQRVKLFKFDPDSTQWKERGVGVLKLLKNTQNGRLRVLMRREQVLKVCANHLITTTMNLKPLAGSDKAWVWLASDFSEGDVRQEQLAAKFKTAELAEEFQLKFEECQRLLLDIPLQTPHKLVDTGRTARLIQKAEEMKTGLKDLRSFLTDDKTKLKEDEGQAVGAGSDASSSLLLKARTDCTGPTLEWDNYDLREEALDDSADASDYATPLDRDSPVRKNLFRFGESTSGFSFSFQPVVSPAKSPGAGRPNQSRGSVGTDDEHDASQEEERDGQYFEPVVPLPDLVDISTGEENEQVLFSHRAKLYRYDKELNQWKERGIGDLKILQHLDSRRVRLIMRRDQVLKICANHWVTSAMKLEPMKGAEKAWVWSALDCAEGDGSVVEQLAVRFKLQEVATHFRDVFDEAKTALENNVLLTPATPEATPAEATPTLKPASETTTSTTTTTTIATAAAMTTPLKNLPVCGKEAIAVLEETTRERTELPSSDTFYTPDSHSSSAPPLSPGALSKALVSPPKFVFGKDSLQKIFGSPPKGGSSSEAEESTSSASSKSNSRTVQPPSAASPAFKVPDNAPPQAEGSGADSEVEVVYAREPSTEQAALARQLLLPLTFFCYQNEPGYTSDDQTDDEDFESAVRALNGKLYADDEPARRPASSVSPSGDGTSSSGQAEETVGHSGSQAAGGDPDCEVVWEKKPTPEEEEKAKVLQLPPTFFCGTGCDGEADKDKSLEDFETEVRKAHEALEAELNLDAAPPLATTETETVAPTEDHTAEPCGAGFSTLFGQKPGQWDCDTCASENEASEDSCVACQSPKLSAIGTTDTHATSTTLKTVFDSGFVAGFGAQFVKKAGQWDCATCVVRNESTAESCVSCRTPNPSAKSTAEPPAAPESSTSIFGSGFATGFGAGFGAKFEMKPGQWECATCVVRNESTAESCVSCRTPNPSAKSTAEPTAAPESSTSIFGSGFATGFGAGFGAKFEMKPGQWDCATCVVRNESTAESCVSCQTPNPSAKSTAEPTAAPESSTSIFGSGFGSGFGDQFNKKQGQWDCVTCAVRNEASASSCVSCQTPNASAIDLSTKKTDADSVSSTTNLFTTTTTGQDAGFGFQTLGGFSFADLAKNTGEEFAFGKQDSEFSWANAGAAVFGSAAPPRKEGEEEGSGEEDANNDDIHFEPIVSLPEVEVKSGEEDEEILFKERTKLYRWDRDSNQWKERGVGDIKILFHPDKRFYRVLMRREQVLRVCANHTLADNMELKPMNTSANALVWTATDYAEGEGKVEQLAAKFKTPELAESFRKVFCECQRRMVESAASPLSSTPQLSRVQEHSRETNPQVFLTVAADDQPLGTVTVELFSHIVPKTAENFRALCTRERGFGFLNSVFHRVVPDFMCQGGDITNQDGTGGKSIYGGKFEDENFDVRHTGPGLLSMANRGRDTNNSQFFITLKKAEHLDFKHVSFGFVRDGMDVVRQMGELGTKSGKPTKKIVVTDCGQL